MNDDTVIIEQGHAAPQEAEALLDAAFGLDRRTKASYRLREGATPVPGLSFTARHREDNRLVGMISFWPLRAFPEGVPALLLGPLAVHPDMQRQGLGAALIGQGLMAAARQGHRLVFLVGDAPYYERFGFRPVLPHGRLLLPGPFDPGRLLYRELAPGAMNERVHGLLLPEWRWQQAVREGHVPPRAG
jgi:predicted N-acetyltransferase YhbS